MKTSNSKNNNNNNNNNKQPITKGSLFDSIGKRESKNKAIEHAKKYGPSSTRPWPCHIKQVDKDFLYADPKFEVVPLDHCPFIPTPVHLVGDKVREELDRMSLTIFDSVCALPMVYSFPMFTPSLLIRLSSKPISQQIEEIKGCQKALEQKYTRWIDEVTKTRKISVEEADRLPESQSMQQNAMELSIMEYSFEQDTAKYLVKKWPKIISSTEVITQYLRVKRLICMTKGFVEVDSQISNNYVKRFETCENMLKVDLVKAHNTFIAKLSLDRYCTQLQKYGKLCDLSANSDKDVAMILMQYTFAVIQSLEKWVLRAAGGVREQLMFYHLSCPSILPYPTDVPDSIVKQCRAHQFKLMSFRKISSVSMVRQWYKNNNFSKSSSLSSNSFDGGNDIDFVPPELTYTLSYKPEEGETRKNSSDFLSKKEHRTDEMICSILHYLFQEYCHNNRGKLLEENYEQYHDLMRKQCVKKTTIEMYLPGLEEPLTC